MLKKFVLLAVPVGAMTGPYLIHTGPQWVSQVTASLSQESEVAGQADAASAPAASDGTVANIPLEGSVVSQFWEVLRFDISPSFVTQRWPRVATSLYELDLQGFRVPLVTGTNPDDLAGSLTYYFNQERRLQRITFTGTTGDYRRLLHLLTNYYRFVSRPTNTPDVMVFEVPAAKEAASYLWIRPVDVLRADQPLSRFHLTLVLERPS